MKVDNLEYFFLLFELTCLFHFQGLVKVDGQGFFILPFFLSFLNLDFFLFIFLHEYILGLMEFITSGHSLLLMSDTATLFFQKEAETLPLLSVL